MEKASRFHSIILTVLTMLFLGTLWFATFTPETALAANSKLTTQQLKTTQATVASKLGLTSGHTYVVYSATGSSKSLEVAGSSTSNNANVQIWDFGRLTSQQWVMTIDSKGYATFKSVVSNKYLAVSGSKKASGTNVVQSKASNSSRQKWKITKNSNGTFRIASVLAPKCSLDVNGGKNTNGTNVHIWTANKSAAQQWKFYDVTKMRNNLTSLAKKNKGTIKAGKYVIFSKAGSGMVLDISGGSTANCANLQTWSYNGSAAQRFTVSYDKNGYAMLKNDSGKYVDVYKGSAMNCTNVQQYTGNNSLAQKWIITKNSDNSYRIRSALWAGISLDVHGGTAKEGSNMEIYTSHNKANQKWTFLTPSAAAKTVPVRLSGTAKSSYDGISTAGAKAAGIDVSVWNGDINWSKVAASGIKFAIIRCGYGDNYTSQDDSKFLSNVKGARAAGLDIGVYLYSYAVRTTGAESAQSEADHTLRLLKSAGLTPKNLKYGVYYDVEDASQASANLTAICKKYCNTIKASGYSVGVYSYLNWWNSKLTDSSFGNWNRWIAQWPYKTGGKTCDYKGKYKIWQCMSDGSVPGIVGRVDMNLAY